MKKKVKIPFGFSPNTFLYFLVIALVAVLIVLASAPRTEYEASNVIGGLKHNTIHVELGKCSEVGKNTVIAPLSLEYFKVDYSFKKSKLFGTIIEVNITVKGKDVCYRPVNIDFPENTNYARVNIIKDGNLMDTILISKEKLCLDIRNNRYYVAPGNICRINSPIVIGRNISVEGTLIIGEKGTVILTNGSEVKVSKGATFRCKGIMLSAPQLLSLSENLYRCENKTVTIYDIDSKLNLIPLYQFRAECCSDADCPIGYRCLGFVCVQKTEGSFERCVALGGTPIVKYEFAYPTFQAQGIKRCPEYYQEEGNGIIGEYVGEACFRDEYIYFTGSALARSWKVEEGKVEQRGDAIILDGCLCGGVEGLDYIYIFGKGNVTIRMYGYYNKYLSGRNISVDRSAFFSARNNMVRKLCICGNNTEIRRIKIKTSRKLVYLKTKYIKCCGDDSGEKTADECPFGLDYKTCTCRPCLCR